MMMLRVKRMIVGLMRSMVSLRWARRCKGFSWLTPGRLLDDDAKSMLSSLG